MSTVHGYSVNAYAVMSSDVVNLGSDTQQTTPFDLLKNAVEANDLEGVKSALRDGANPNDLLHVASDKGNVDIVRELLDRGADVNLETKESGDTPLHRACICGHAKVVQELIKRNADINRRNTNCYRTPLEYAIEYTHADCCRLLLGAGAIVNAVNRNYGSTPLMEACALGNVEIAQMLLNFSADPNLRTDSTPLYNAVPTPQIVQLLVDKGAYIDAESKTREGFARAIHKAAQRGEEESVKILLKAGASTMPPSVKAPSSISKSPLQVAKIILRQTQNIPYIPPDTAAQKAASLASIITALEESV